MSKRRRIRKRKSVKSKRQRDGENAFNLSDLFGDVFGNGYTSFAVTFKNGVAKSYVHGKLFRICKYFRTGRHAGKLRCIAVPNGEIATVYSYDKQNRLTKIHDGISKTETFYYDKRGKFIQPKRSKAKKK